MIVFLVITFINLLIFFSRDHFSYKPYISYSAIYGPCDRSCLQKWEQFTSDYPRADMAEGRKIMETAPRLKTKNTQDRIVEIGRFLYTKFYRQMGRPSPAVATATPLNQYKMFCSSDSLKLWCGSFALMFNFFCWSEGISCRIIEIMNPGDHHVLNECYIPENKQWVMVDVTNNQLLVQNSNKQLLNLVEFEDQLKKPSSLLALSASGDSVGSKPISREAGYIHSYYKNKKPVYYYYRVNLDEVYRTTSKIRRYLLPVSWYVIFDSNKHNNILFYTRQLLIFLWVLLFIFLLLVILRKAIF